MFLFDTDYYVSKFDKIVKKLNAVADQHQQNFYKHNGLSTIHKAHAEDAANEAVRARAIAKKIEDLITA